MSLQFVKMHGLGNDFILVSLFDQAVSDPAELACRISDRNRGVGGDGLILAAPPFSPHADVRMIFFNPDGSRAQMCGNGVRCLAKLAYERGLARRNPLRIETDAGVLVVNLTVAAGKRVTAIRVDLGEPILDPRRIPVALSGERAVDVPIPFSARDLRLTCVSMGNPHAVFFEPDLSHIPLADWGPQLECHPLFPERTNVHFVQVLQPDRVKMITWERGTGLTQACGTGAAAACVAGVLNQLTQRAICVELAGGELQVQWDEMTNHVFQTGPAEEVFVGQWPG